MTIEHTALLPSISNVDYHADRASLSCSGAKLILRSPAKFVWQQDHPVFKDVFDFGTVAHTLVLGEGGDIMVLDPEVHGLKKDGTVADNPRATTTWKTAESEARQRGQTPIPLADYQTCSAMADMITTHTTARELLASGIAERSGYWQDEPTDTRLRFRPDWLTEFEGRPVCVDYKTAASADTDDFMRAAARFGYDLQFAWYVAGLVALGIDNPRMVFVAQEKSPPFEVNVIELPDEAFESGKRQMRQAIDTFARCVESGTWPSAYGDGINTGDWPVWAMDDVELKL